MPCSSFVTTQGKVSDANKIMAKNQQAQKSEQMMLKMQKDLVVNSAKKSGLALAKAVLSSRKKAEKA